MSFTAIKYRCPVCGWEHVQSTTVPAPVNIANLPEQEKALIMQKDAVALQEAERKLAEHIKEHSIFEWLTHSMEQQKEILELRTQLVALEERLTNKSSIN